MQILAFALGVTQILAFLDTNLLVCPTQNCGAGGLSQRQDPMQMVLRRSGIYAIVFFIELTDDGWSMNMQQYIWIILCNLTVS